MSLVTRWSLVGLGLGLVLLFPEQSRANGAFPAVSQLVVEPTDTTHLVLRSNFGLLVSRDSGGSWGWVCEGSLGYLDIEPPIAVAPGGATLLALPTGVAVVEASGCNFHKAAGIDANVTDLSIELAKPNAVLAVSVNLETNTSQVWESLDAGASFTALGGAIGSFSALTIDASKTDGNRIYLSGMSAGAAPRGILLTSRDHGQTWQAGVVPNSDSARPPYIAALHPLDSGTVYVRTNGFPGSLAVTRDGGESFVEALSLPSPVQGFAVSPDGSTLLASAVNSGIFRASAETLEFERLTCEGVSCLSWSEAGLLGCGDQATNGFTLGLSADEALLFDPSSTATASSRSGAPRIARSTRCAPRLGPWCRKRWGKIRSSATRAPAVVPSTPVACKAKAEQLAAAAVAKQARRVSPPHEPERRAARVAKLDKRHSEANRTAALRRPTPRRPPPLTTAGVAAVSALLRRIIRSIFSAQCCWSRGDVAPSRRCSSSWAVAATRRPNVWRSRTRAIPSPTAVPSSSSRAAISGSPPTMARTT